MSSASAAASRDSLAQNHDAQQHLNASNLQQIVPSSDLDTYNGPRYTRLRDGLKRMLAESVDLLSYSEHLPPALYEVNKTLVDEHEKRVRSAMQKGVFDEMSRIEQDYGIRRKLNYLDLRIATDDPQGQQKDVYLLNSQDQVSIEQWLQQNKFTKLQLKQEMEQLLAQLRQSNRQRQERIDRLRASVAESKSFLQQRTKILDDVLSQFGEGFAEETNADIQQISQKLQQFALQEQMAPRIRQQQGLGAQSSIPGAIGAINNVLAKSNPALRPTDAEGDTEMADAASTSSAFDAIAALSSQSSGTGSVK